MVGASSLSPRTYNVALQQKINSLSLKVLGKEILCNYPTPNKYTGELFGIQYLYAQSGGDLTGYIEEDVEGDEGFGEGSEEISNDLSEPMEATLSSNEEEDNELDVSTDEDATEDSRGIPGWDKVHNLAEVLLSLKGLGVSNAQKELILKLYNQLHEYDRRPLVFQPRQYTRVRGRFGRSKSGPPTVDYMKRCFLSAAQSPKKSRVVEAVVQSPVGETLSGTTWE